MPFRRKTARPACHRVRQTARRVTVMTILLPVVFQFEISGLRPLLSMPKDSYVPETHIVTQTHSLYQNTSPGYVWPVYGTSSFTVL